MHIERHKNHRIGWLRAAVLGANDGIVSTASLILGVAAAGVDGKHILIAGVAGLVAGAMSMAAGEYVSVCSQADTEHADLERERRELAAYPEHEHAEMTSIYVERGLDETLAAEVARQLMAYDALGAHSRDELGITDTSAARPVLAAFSSAASFSIGAILPLSIVFWAPAALLIWAVASGSLALLVSLGVLSARAGGASMLVAGARVSFLGALAMGLTTAVGTLFGVAV
ncbi:VIT1/CCC1 transporter family protein [Methylomonas fluvii]|uniref:VIT family protein n=1 Tax=Methylomonas fluvii TaxID=1854564 RepID=A0ABR9DFU8_9GAMM|nr:VIT family protein [Methylomonas fluvii]MBD9361968.1 VIT family protein [Methylomonas fluvii]